MGQTLSRIRATAARDRVVRATLVLAAVYFVALGAACGDDDAAPLDASASDASADAADLAAAPDLGAPDLTNCADDDGDGHRAAACGGDDCDDADASRYPGATETCDGDDEDCNDTTYGADADADGFESSACCNRADNCGADCDDALTTVSPSAAESCNGGVDDDCDGLTDAADGVCVPCASGYVGFDGDCTDVDECAVSEFCGLGAIACTNVPGTFVCSCTAGYAPTSPAGGLCGNVDECAAPVNPCGVGTCVDNAGSYLCTCPPAYRLATSPTITCRDVDECLEGTDLCTNAPAASCTNTAGSYDCACPVGYAGTGRGAGGCGDIDECTVGTDDCDDLPGACTNTMGSFSCVCPSGFVGPGRGCRWDNPALASLVFGAGSAISPAFSPTTTSYVVSLAPGATSGAYTIGLAHPTRATITVGGAAAVAGASRPITVTSLTPTVLTIVVTTETGATRTYSVVVGRGPTYVKASNADAFDQFGGAIALSADGTTMAVGGYLEDSSARGVGAAENDNSAMATGAVYVFRRSAGVWAQQAYIKASNADAFDAFGYALALSADGSTLAVGAYGEASAARGIGGVEADNANVGAGAAYVFRRTGTAWAQEAYVKATNSGAGDQFGIALSLSGDGNTLAVGARAEDSNAIGVGGDQSNDLAVDSGAVYVYRRAGVTWTSDAYLKASNAQDDDAFGTMVALSFDGSVLAAAAPSEDSNATGVGGAQGNNASPFAGAVYVFRRGATSWSQEAYVKASNTGPTDQFGRALAVSGDGATFAVGTSAESSNASGVGGSQVDDSAPYAGAVYVFRRAAGVWAQEAYVKASNTDSGDGFGGAVSLSSDGATLAVGAAREYSGATGMGGSQADNSVANAGAVYVLRRTGSTWTHSAYVKSSNTDSDEFGNAVALSADGSALAVGAMFEESNARGIGGDQFNDARDASGAAYVF